MVGFDITHFMSDESKKGIKDNFKIEKVSVRKMKPSKDNFYSIDEEEITRLARTIELVGLQQNFVVKKMPGAGIKDGLLYLSSWRKARKSLRCSRVRLFIRMMTLKMNLP